MNFRTVGAVATLLLGVAWPGDQATAQYYPPPQAYPPQSYPPAQGHPPYRPAPALEEDDDAFYDPPMVQRRPLPPIGGGGAQMGDPLPPASVRSARGVPAYPEDVELLPPPPGYFYREGPRGYELSADPNSTRPAARPNYATPSGLPPALPPATAIAPGEQDAVRPPMAIGPAHVDPGPTGTARGDVRMAALPPEVPTGNRSHEGTAGAVPPHAGRLS